MIYIKDRIYILGGTNGTFALKTVESFKIKSDTDLESIKSNYEPSMKKARQNFGVTVCGN